MFPQIWTQIKHYHKDDEEDKLNVTTKMMIKTNQMLPQR